jgi:hypothetical protein
MMGGVLLTGKAMRQPQWTYGMVLRRGKVRVMFIKFDIERQRMLGGGLAQFQAARLDNNDRTNPQYTPIGSVGNYSITGWHLDDD